MLFSNISKRLRKPSFQSNLENRDCSAFKDGTWRTLFCHKMSLATVDQKVVNLAWLWLADAPSGHALHSTLANHRMAILSRGGNATATSETYFRHTASHNERCHQEGQLFKFFSCFTCDLSIKLSLPSHIQCRDAPRGYFIMRTTRNKINDLVVVLYTFRPAHNCMSRDSKLRELFFPSL